jgi:hypothetical protein
MYRTPWLTIELTFDTTILWISTNKIARGRDGREPWYVKKPEPTSMICFVRKKKTRTDRKNQSWD